jgi:type I restriction enzyme S subunit
MYPVETELETRYLKWWMLSPEFTRQAASEQARTVLPKINKRALGRIAVPVPPTHVQRRIVDILEDHLSRLDAAGNYVHAAERRLDILITSILLDLIPEVDAYPARWERSCVGDAGTVELGRQRHPDWHSGPNMRPYLRVANVFEDRIDTGDVMDMHWPPETFERFKLRVGDILLNEGQTPDLLGRPALYRGVPTEVAFTNSLLRFVASDRVLPEFALLVFRRHMRAGRFKRESRITTNIAHLSASRLKPIEFPIPDMDEQAAIVERAKNNFDAVARQRAELVRAKVRAEQLRGSLLAAAFSGRLTSSSSELVEELESV